MRNLVGGNWKHDCNEQTLDTLGRFTDEHFRHVEAFIAVEPAHMSLVKPVLPKNVALGAQNVRLPDSEVQERDASIERLKEENVKFVIVGHSSRRNELSESNATVNKKLKCVLDGGLTPVLCVGEGSHQREQGTHIEYVRNQLDESVGDISGAWIEIAYEPEWAVGTDHAADCDQIKEMVRLINKWKKEHKIDGRILYGGALTSSDVPAIARLEFIGGALVGRASLTQDFQNIAYSFGQSR